MGEIEIVPREIAEVEDFAVFDGAWNGDADEF